jgi:hypothetical protein
MKQFFLIPLVLILAAVSPLLNGCVTTSATVVTATETFIAEVQADAKAACDVVPDALSIGALFTGNALLQTVSAMSAAICGAVTGSNVAGVKMVRRSVRGVVRTVHAPVTVGGVTVTFID